MTIKVLLDTDIGSDIDDAVCLAYLLAQPECDLLGVTTVTGEAKKRAMMVSALCKAAGQDDIPVFPGAEEPLQVAQRQPESPQAEALSKWAHDTDFSQGEAVNFLRQTIRQHPGEITLLTIGPLTNIALLFDLDPEIPALLKEIVIMGGYFVPPPDEEGLEWNIICDPHAAANVFASRARIRAVGIEITRQVTMDAETVRRRFQTGFLRPVLDFAEVYFQDEDHITFHDPLAATTIFDDRICAFTHGSVHMDLTDLELPSITRWQAGGAESFHEVATSVDAERFFEHFFSVFR